MSEQQTLSTEPNGPANFGNTKRPMPRGARGFLLLSALIAVVVIFVVLWRSFSAGETPIIDDEEPTKSGIFHTLKLPEINRAMPQQQPAPEPVSFREPEEVMLPLVLGLDQQGALPLNDVAQRRLRSPLNPTESNNAASGSNQTSAQQPQYGDAGPLADKLRPLELQPSVAGQLGDRNFLITQGTMIDCVMQTKLVTAQAGMLTCSATQDVMSANGKVVLIDAGTKFTGYQSGGITQGQVRAFITWNRLETPQGVILNLGSPGTGALGEAGVDGAIDHHFWDRFGNAILLSLVGDLGDWAANQGNRGDNNIRFSNTSDGAQEIIAKVLEHSLDIPPTLYKNQGERVGIMVARDLDFSKVYSLKTAY